LCGRDGRTICGPLRQPKSTYVTLAHKRKQKFFYFGCLLVRRFYCKITKLLPRTGRTDRQTDRQTDRVRRNMRPPPREEGRIKTHTNTNIIHTAPSVESLAKTSRRRIHLLIMLTQSTTTTEATYVQGKTIDSTGRKMEFSDQSVKNTTLSFPDWMVKWHIHTKPTKDTVLDPQCKQHYHHFSTVSTCFRHFKSQVVEIFNDSCDIFIFIHLLSKQYYANFLSEVNG